MTGIKSYLTSKRDFIKAATMKNIASAYNGVGTAYMRYGLHVKQNIIKNESVYKGIELSYGIPLPVFFASICFRDKGIGGSKHN